MLIVSPLFVTLATVSTSFSFLSSSFQEVVVSTNLSPAFHCTASTSGMLFAPTSTVVAMRVQVMPPYSTGTGMADMRSQSTYEHPEEEP